MTISGEVLLMTEDVSKDKAALEACKEILMRNGASRVAMLALGQSLS